MNTYDRVTIQIDITHPKDTPETFKYLVIPEE